MMDLCFALSWLWWTNAEKWFRFNSQQQKITVLMFNGWPPLCLLDWWGSDPPAGGGCARRQNPHRHARTCTRVHTYAHTHTHRNVETYSQRENLPVTVFSVLFFSVTAAHPKPSLHVRTHSHTHHQRPPSPSPTPQQTEQDEKQLPWHHWNWHDFGEWQKRKKEKSEECNKHLLCFAGFLFLVQK